MQISCATVAVILFSSHDIALSQHQGVLQCRSMIYMFLFKVHIWDSTNNSAINKISSAASAGLARFRFDKQFVIADASMPHLPSPVVRQLAEAATIHANKYRFNVGSPPCLARKKTSSPRLRRRSVRSLYYTIAQWHPPRPRERERFRGHLGLASALRQNSSKSFFSCATFAHVALTLSAIFSWSDPKPTTELAISSFVLVVFAWLSCSSNTPPSGVFVKPPGLSL